MKRLLDRRIAFVLAILTLGAPVRAQTNVVMSQVASYQFYDTTAGTGVSLTSPFVAYQFYDTFNDMGANSVIMTPVPAYYYKPDSIYLTAAWAGGLPQLSLYGPAGTTYNVEFSTNLVQWTNLTALSIAFPDLSVQYSDSASTNYNCGYYQVGAPSNVFGPQIVAHSLQRK